jgi:CTP synthase (UTP-ammonia lyase)
MEGALRTIRFARERNIPFLGTCGGFQHALIEYCRSVLALAGADHAESNPSASFALITPLSCPLRETAARIHLRPGSRAAAIYGRPETIETFNCGYGLSPEHQPLFSNGALRISGVADDGSVRIVELQDHAFFLAALFQPERSAERNHSHPLIVAFAHAALAA